MIFGFWVVIKSSFFAPEPACLLGPHYFATRQGYTPITLSLTVEAVRALIWCEKKNRKKMQYHSWESGLRFAGSGDYFCTENMKLPACIEIQQGLLLTYTDTFVSSSCICVCICTVSWMYFNTCLLAVGSGVIALIFASNTERVPSIVHHACCHTGQGLWVCVSVCVRACPSLTLTCTWKVNNEKRLGW